MYLWRAVDDEGEALDVLVQKRRNKHAALKLLRRLLRNAGVHPGVIVTDKLASYRTAMKVLNLQIRHRCGGMQENNHAENSHLVIRQREPNSRSSNPKVQRSVPFQSRSDLQHLQSATPSDLPPRAPHGAGSGKRRLGGDDSGCLKREGGGAFSARQSQHHNAGGRP
ncbi:MAG: DDE-type integrase/transposase/recombinase [Brevundimonas sp.]|uniref:DDE-type integrase/transposase/recombinase n=1 Tax=Brevundimonas sp. TaxID=1871086 RepID=UPI0027334485|nr:DDE-type integrase/transposase/recombinase [Brevundimonas sp.]MDP3404438.1 DDE-type integrase/transposase/recombinase [Brevundimonas sp.]